MIALIALVTSLLAVCLSAVTLWSVRRSQELIQACGDWIATEATARIAKRAVARRSSEAPQEAEK